MPALDKKPPAGGLVLTQNFEKRRPEGRRFFIGVGPRKAGWRGGLQLQLFDPQPRFQGLVEILDEPAASVLVRAGPGLGEVRDGLVAEQ